MTSRLAERRLLRAAARRRRRGGHGRAPVVVQRLARGVEDTAYAAREVGRSAVAGDRPLAVGLVVLLILGIAMISGPFQTYLEGRERVELLQRQLGALEGANAELDERREGLADPDQIELLARERQGMIFPGEVPYAVVPPEADLPRITQRPQVGGAPDRAWYERFWSGLTDLFG